MSRYRTQRYDPEVHRADEFACGDDSLDAWLRDHAASVQARNTARVFVLTAEDAQQVLGYFCLSAHVVTPAELPRSLARGSASAIPAVLLGKFAVDRSVQGEGLGGLLLVAAIRRVVRATQTVAARYLVVDALDERAESFYRHHGFRPVDGTRRLVLPIKDLAATLEG